MPHFMIYLCILTMGHRRFAERLRAQGIPFAVAHRLIFNRAPRPIE